MLYGINLSESDGVFHPEFLLSLDLRSSRADHLWKLNCFATTHKIVLFSFKKGNVLILLLHIRHCLHYHVLDSLICACPLIHHALSTGLQNSG